LDGIAAQNNHVQIEQRILASDNTLIDVKCDDGITAAVIAASCGHAKILDFCLQRGADRNSADTRGYPTLHLALLSRSLDAVKVTLSHGVDPDLGRGPDGSAAIHLAAALNQTSIVELLLNFHGRWSTLCSIQRAALYGVCQGFVGLSEQGQFSIIDNSVRLWTKNQINERLTQSYTLIKQKSRIFLYEQAVTPMWQFIFSRKAFDRRIRIICYSTA
jgi:hypothetical protein